MKLEIFKGDDLIHSLNLKAGKTYLAGRKEDCEIPLEKLPGISRQHFQLSEQEAGIWQVKVLSKVMLVEHEDEEKDEFNLIGQGEFWLRPYRFVFGGSQDKRQGQEVRAASPVRDTFDLHASTDFATESAAQLVPTHQPEVEVDSATANLDMASDDEKTAIQNFAGVPYMKIIGQNGRKSEYFRLEGNLWVVGRDENASIYVKDPNVAHNHFEISKTDKGFFITDSGSSIGTELNGQRLQSGKPNRLLSGDIVVIGGTSLQFELRDQAFQRKISNIPLNVYKNPLVFFDQEVAMVSFEEADQGPGRVEEVSTNLFADPQKRKKFILAAMAGVLVAAVLAKEFISSAHQLDKQEVVGADPFSQLAPAEQKIVVQTHKLAKQLYLAGNFELALVQLEKLHSIIPSYKDSKEMEEYCINSREIKQQQVAIEQQRREQEELQRRLNSLLAQCYAQYQASDDVDGIKACLAPAMDLDPSNPGISQLIAEVTARAEEKAVREKIAREEEEKARRGQELYEKAKTLHAKRLFHEAMEAYENHIHSGLPDPKNLVKVSKRKLATIETKIRTERDQLMQTAQSQYGGSRLKEAIELARQAREVDPFDPKISAFIHQAKLELTGKMRNLYMDSVIEEKFGNLEASRLKWEEIIRLDVTDGEYYKKSKRKLRQYGYHP